MRVLRVLLVLIIGLPGNAPQDSSSGGALLTGEVRDADGRPIPAAVVRIKGEPASVYTDAAGRFELRHPPAARRVTAWKAGYFIAGADVDAVPLVLTLRRLPAEDCERYVWIDPAPDPRSRHNCGNCHGEIYREWNASGHARAASNRRLLNLYDGSDWHGRRGIGWDLSADHPDGGAVCASCHAPTAGFNDDLTRLTGVAAHGVHCDYCHKVAGVTDGPLGLTHGRFGLRLLRPEKDQLFFGSLDDVDRAEDAYSPLYRQSRYCASCHEGVVFGVHVYSTYSEWFASPARQQGRQCQDCHMAPTGHRDNVAPGRGGIPRDPATLANHRFFDVSQEEMLRRCLKVTASAVPENDALQVAVEVRVEGAGHRVPTGFVDRHLILVVEAFDAKGRPLPLREGDALPAAVGPTLAGRAGQLYARQLTNFDGRSPAPFWVARPEFTDTRLLPGQAERRAFRFAGSGTKVRVRLLYRRFWEEVSRTKGWPDDTLTVFEQSLRVAP